MEWCEEKLHYLITAFDKRITEGYREYNDIEIDKRRD